MVDIAVQFCLGFKIKYEFKALQIFFFEKKPLVLFNFQRHLGHSKSDDYF